MKYFEVAIPVNINSYFTYSYGSDEDLSGRRVLVNFHNRKLLGFVVGEGKYSDEYKIKPIEKVIDNEAIFTEDMVDFAKWISQNYFCSVGEALALMLPKGIRKKDSKENESKHNEPKKNQEIKLSEDQLYVYENILKDISNNINKFYLYGVTGSGKTEIYTKLIEKVLEEGKSVIFLVPEIVLSYQTLDRLKTKFGNICSVIHSGLSTSKRLEEYLKIKNGKTKIVVGARSAIFSPVKNLGLIIIDEEHESSYKSDESPRYNARSLALYLSNKYNAIVLFGSATPSIESYYFAKSNYLKLYKLEKRFGGAELPDIKVVDTSELPPQKHLSKDMILEIKKRLENKEQILLLQNRRGFSNLIQCKDCKNIINCPKCEISLTYHKSKNKLICHRCGYSINMITQCPDCGSNKLFKIGAGTEKIEEEISKIFSFAKVVRIDFDSLKKHNINQVFKEIEEGKIDIIVGTQMIAKGIHFPNIKFVGVVDADIFLNIPDFKASERAYSLITQVAGRSGRVGEKGFVIIQTMNSEHYAIKNAIQSNYEAFFNEEIFYRKEIDLPPFKRMIRLLVRGKQEDLVVEDIKKINDKIHKIVESLKKSFDINVEIMGYSQCVLPKINDNYRYHIIIKDKKMENLKKVVQELLKDIKINSKNYLEIDVDPYDLI